MKKIKIKKVRLEDLQKSYRVKSTKSVYRVLWNRLLAAMEAYPVAVVDGEEKIVFASLEKYEDFIRSVQNSFEKDSMKQLFYGMYNGLVRRFRLPKVDGLNVGFRPKHHKGFTVDERKRILKYCLSSKDDHERSMCIAKFTTVVLLETGLRAFEFKEFAKKFVESPAVINALKKQNVHATLANPNFELDDVIDIRGKRNIPRNISVTQNILRLWKKVLRKERSKFKMAISPSQVENRLSQVLTKLNIKSTPHSCRVSFCTQLKEMGVPMADIQELMGHTNITQTDKYIRKYQAPHLARMAMLGKNVDTNKQTSVLIEKVDNLEVIIKKILKLFGEQNKNSDEKY